MRFTRITVGEIAAGARKLFPSLREHSDNAEITIGTLTAMIVMINRARQVPVPMAQLIASTNDFLVKIDNYLESMGSDNGRPTDTDPRQ